MAHVCSCRHTAEKPGCGLLLAAKQQSSRQKWGDVKLALAMHIPCSQYTCTLYDDECLK